MSNNYTGEEELDVEEVCISDEVGLATEGIVIFSYVFIGISILVVVSGGIFWYIHRKNNWLIRRYPKITIFYVAPVISSNLIGPIYRIFLNSNLTFFSECFFGNFTLSSVAVFVLLPNMIRIILFTNRIHLTKKLVDLDTSENEEELLEDKKISVYDVNKKQSSVFFKSMKRYGKKTFKNPNAGLIQRLKYRTSAVFGFRIAFFYFVLVVAISILFMLITCPVSIFNSDNCQYGFTLIGSIFFVLPIVPTLIVFFYFKNIARKAPDPFGLKREINQFLVFVVLALIVFIFDALNVGGLKKENEVGFKFILLLDVLVLLIFIHGVHYQVYLSIKNKENPSQIVPVSLEEILDHREGRQIFKRFLEYEFNVELYIVYSLCQNWQMDRLSETADLEVMDTRARKIFDSWVDRSGDNIVVNISHVLYNELEQNILNLPENEHYSPQVFDKLQKELFRLMNADSFHRFTNTTDYKVFSGLIEPKNASTRVIPIDVDE